MIVAGFGFRGLAPLSALTDALGAALALAPGIRLDALATARHKAGARVIQSFATTLALPLCAVEVAGQETPSRSVRIVAGFDTGSLAEAAALRAAGPGARLIVWRVVSADGMATAAIAEGEGLGQ